MDAHRFDRRRTLRRLGAAATLLGGAAAGRAAGPQPERVTISVGGRASLYYLPLCIAEQLGYFGDEGLAVHVTDFAGGSLARDALLGGAFDVCSGAYEHTIELQAAKRFCQAFVLQGRAPQIAFGVSTRALPDYQDPAELRGRRIGVSAPGSSTNRVAQRVLMRAGIAPDAVQWVGVGTGAAAVHALRDGAIDAISNVEPVITLLEQSGSLRVVSDTRTLKGTIELFGDLPPAACLYAPASYLDRHPATVQALANAVVRALKWLQTAGPSDLVHTVPASHLLDNPALYLASFSKVRETLSPDGIISASGALSALRGLTPFDGAVRADRIDLARTFTNRFAARAKARAYGAHAS